MDFIGFMHCFKRSFEYIDTVDFSMVDHCYRPGNGLCLNDGAQFASVGLCDLLAVIEQRVIKPGRQDNGSGKDGPCEAPPAGFIAAGLDNTCLETAFEQIELFAAK